MAKTTCEIVWIQGLLSDLGIQVNGPSELFCDNDAALKLAANPVFHERTKYIEVDCHFTQDKIKEGVLVTKGIGTVEQPADIFTKPLCQRQHKYLLSKLVKKRGLSLEEKREKILQIFYDSQDFFLVYFWSLHSCTRNQLQNVYRKLESDVQSSKRRPTELTDQCNALKKGREESEERKEALSNLKKVEEKYNELEDEMAEYADNDPAAFEAMKDAILVAHADNIFPLRQWCSNNFPEAKEQLKHMYQEVLQVGITNDLDYLEM
ncbi:hypothetical protein BT93_L2760 [Corymbia citriodora subsp. variegata]|uniref:Leucine zipper with capping helix domain-containing protein n=1 Tax=Corymbia citriodora subsp. variegata TaxID=360336 RepID=A0A8T0CK78_CORYI|nr:hypothetical protein BT93_L2760 [Corymbia citriodora subsp. variegata]